LGLRQAAGTRARTSTIYQCYHLDVAVTESLEGRVHCSAVRLLNLLQEAGTKGKSGRKADSNT